LSSAESRIAAYQTAPLICIVLFVEYSVETMSRRPQAEPSEPNSRHPVTAYEVARVAGVSQSAVSRAFTPGSSISERTRSRVADAARKLNYRPNLIARSLALRRSKIVGVIVPPLGNPFLPQLLEALSVSFSAMGYRVLLFTSYMQEAPEPLLEDVLNSRVDALVMISASVSSHFVEQCQASQLPIVLLNRTTTSRLVSRVTGDNVGGAATIASFLIAAKHRRFAYLAGLEDSSTSRDREASFTARLAREGKALSARAVGHFDFKGSMDATRQILRQRKRLDAIFCANDLTAMAAIQIARHEFGLDVGRQISIIGFDDAEQASWPCFDLTTYEQPAQAMADAVTTLLDKQLKESPAGRAELRVVPGDLVVRSSARLPALGITGPPERRIWIEPGPPLVSI